MTDLATFCSALGLDDAAARRVIDDDACERPMPLYAQIILGGGAWITALAMIVFVIAFCALVLDVDEPGLPFSLFGAAAFASGLWLLSRPGIGVFALHFAVALASAGAVMGAADVGFEHSSMAGAVVAAAPFAFLAIWRGRDPLLQFLTVALAVGLAIAALFEAEVPYRTDIVALAAPLGVWLYLRPPARDLRPAATVLLLAMPLLAIADGAPVVGLGEQGGWIARAIHLALFLWLVRLNLPRAGSVDNGFVLAVFALAAILVCLLLPAGGSAALLLLMLAFTLGSRPPAILGTLLQIYFIWQFYYDLEATLLTKSLVLAAAGAVLLAAHAAIAGRDRTGQVP